MISPFAPVEQQSRFFFPPHTHPYRTLEKRLAETIEPHHAVLDIGCGHGAPMLRRWVGKAAKLYGIDLVSFDDSAQEPDFALFNESVTDLKSFADQTIDLAYSRSVMEHIEDPMRAFQEISRVLKPGGRYIFLTPNKYDYAAIMASIIPNRFHGAVVRMTEGRDVIDTFPTYYRSNSHSQITNLAAASGLQLRHFQRLNQYPSYLYFNRVLFWFGCIYEKVIDRMRFDVVKGWIFCELQKPHAQGASRPERR